MMDVLLTNFQAQNVAICQLCETQRNINWICSECEIFMCDKCRNKIHLNSELPRTTQLSFGQTAVVLSLSNIKCKFIEHRLVVASVYHVIHMFVHAVF